MARHQLATLCKGVLMQEVSTLSETEAGSPDPGYDYPHGPVSFEITSPCAPTDVKLYFHGATSLAPPYRKHGPVTPGDPGTTPWYTLPTASFGSGSVGGALFLARRGRRPGSPERG